MQQIYNKKEREILYFGGKSRSLMPRRGDALQRATLCRARLRFWFGIAVKAAHILRVSNFFIFFACFRVLPSAAADSACVALTCHSVDGGPLRYPTSGDESHQSGYDEPSMPSPNLTISASASCHQSAVT